MSRIHDFEQPHSPELQFLDPNFDKMNKYESGLQLTLRQRVV